ncbi:hypothetical protein [Pseudomonas sp. MWU16-30323]|jgi:Ca2+-binding RTX toxin-like protein|uniref:hypothetical protein n=1 Tax=Pseudomonas sp. MWU16-30323 TaxID=2878094 RepID=UPI001CF993E3|nr:hypothetical protein [Pseudomonas sp. MWU16-30323]
MHVNAINPLPQDFRLTPSIVKDGNLTPKIEHFGNVKITSHREPGHTTLAAGDFPPTSKVVIETGSENDEIRIRMGAGDQVLAEINGVTVPLDLDGDWRKGLIVIKTGPGNDKITVENDVSTSIEIDTGEGDDTVKTGGGDAYVKLGEGDDSGALGVGGGALYGEGGNDVLQGGSDGDSHISGGAGNNTIRSGTAGQTWVVAEGNRDDINVLAPTGIITNARSTHMRIEKNAEADIKIDQTAGNTETFILGASQAGDGDENVTFFSGRNEPDKDKRYYIPS